MSTNNARRRSLASPVLILVALLAACSPAAAPSAPDKSNPAAATPNTRVLVAIRGAPASLSAAKTGPNVAGLDGLELLVAAGMAQYDERDSLRPQLATAVPSIENGQWLLLPDGRMEITWAIKPNARWHDGTPVTAADLLFTLQAEQDLETGIVRDNTFDLVESADAQDERTIVVHWKQPYIDADTMFSQLLALPLPKHILERTYREDRANLFGVAHWSTEYVGAGPFKVREWVPDSHVMLEAFPDYVLGRPKVQELEVRFIPDPNTLMANVLAGAVEVTLGRGLDYDQGLQLEERWNAGAIRWSVAGWFKVSPQFVDPRPAVVSDLRFRQALMLATNRQEMDDTFTGGRAGIADTLVLPQSDAFKAVESSIVRYQYDPRRAVEMIDALGYTRGPDGAIRDESGQRLGVEVRTTIGLPIQANVMYALADYWKRIGLDVETIPIAIQQMRDREYRATFPSFEMVSATISLSTKDVGRWHSSKTPLPENRFQITGNDPRYMNPEFDALIDRYIRTVPREPRLQALAGIVHHQTEQLSSMGLFYTLNPSLNPQRVQNVTARFSLTNEAWNAQDWAIR